MSVFSINRYIILNIFVCCPPDNSPPGFIQDVAGQMPSACAASLKRREIRAFWGETLHLATCVDPQRHPQGQPPQWRHNGVEVTMGPRKFLTWDGGLVSFHC